MDDVTSAVDNHLIADILDFSKPFNIVPHKRLIRKLMALGIKDKTLNWISLFSTNRKEIVIVNGVWSKPAEMCSGVPQGSCLRPVLFLAYVYETLIHVLPIPLF